MPAAAVVMARAPRPGACNRRLEPLLGVERCAALQAILVRRAAAWARAVAPQAAAVACVPADACEEMAPLAGGAELWAIEAASPAGERAFERFGGPVLVAGTDMPRLRAEHAGAALLDLREGADLAIGPAHDGGWYLIALREPHLAVLECETVVDCLAVATRLQLEVGLLRMERDLATREDAVALAADPLVPAEVREALRA